MAKFTKLSLAIFALILVTSLVASEARDLKAKVKDNNEPLKPQTFPGFERMFGSPALGGGSSLGMPQFRMPSTGSGLGGLGGSSFPGFPGMPGSGAANTLDKKP